jgi:DNA-binding CsgD family transcriptional regulator/ketosteroid isomerase-like protein
LDSRYEQRIATLRGWFRAFNARDYASIPALFHPDVEYDPTGALAPAGTTYTGHDGVASLMRLIVDRYPDVELGIAEAEDLGQAVLALVTYTAKELPDDVPPSVYSVYEFDGELIRNVRSYVGDTEARAAAATLLDDEFRTLFDSAIEAILLLDEDGFIRDSNESAVALLTRDGGRLNGRHWTEFVPADRSARWDAAWAELGERGQVSGEGIVKIGDERLPVDYRARAGYRPGLHLVLLGQRATDNAPASSAAPTLTPREREIFRLLALGFNAPEIADRLFLSPATVRTHVQNGVARLGARTRVQAVAMAVAQAEILL